MSPATHEPTATEEHGHGHGVRSEEDSVPSLRLVMVGVAALIVFFIGSLLTVSYLHVRQEANGPVVIPPEMGQNKIGLVEQQIFDLAARGQRAKVRQLQRLGSSGWVDRKAGIAHIPIEDAMRMVASGVRPGPTQGGGPPPGGQP